MSGHEIIESLVMHYNYWLFVVLMMIGMHAMLVKNNLVKKAIGMSIFQTAIILFYVSAAAKTEPYDQDGSRPTIPILEHAHGDHSDEHGHDEDGHDTAHPAKHDTHHSEHPPIPKPDAPSPPHDEHAAIDPRKYINPLPHVLMLTAIVVGVSTLGVALALIQHVFRHFGTIEESEIDLMVREEESLP
jgi:multicomponent Na+:H+ antiporter subunit C